MLKFVALGARFPDLLWHSMPTASRPHWAKSLRGSTEDPAIDNLSKAMLRDLGLECDQVRGNVERARWQLGKLF